MSEKENTAGRRVQSAGRFSLGAKIAIIASVAVAALLVGGYLGLSAYVSGGSAILPNVTAAGVELGGLTQEQAQAKLTQETAARFAKQTISFDYPGGTADVAGTNV